MDQVIFRDYTIDENGYLISESFDDGIRQTAHFLYRLRVYSSLETTSTSDYQCHIVFKRADGLTIGPLKMTLGQDEKGKWHRYIDIDKKLTEVKGALAFGVIYAQWEADDNNVLVLKKQLPTFARKLYVYDTTSNSNDEFYDIYAKLNELEFKVEEMVDTTKEVYTQTTEPEKKESGTVWFKITN